MKRKKKFRSEPPSRLCSELGFGDGLDPRFDPRDQSSRVKNRKALQLCAQVRRTLGQVLEGEIADELLQNLFVESVVPAPNASHLLVTVRPINLPNSVPPADVLGRLQQIYGRLRTEVAAAIHRRRAPELIFQLRR